jgi:virginiamycin A acetyltransferase
MNPKRVLKGFAHSACLLLMFPFGLLSGFGRFRAPFTFCAHACAQMPGLPGDYVRAAFYRLTLEDCPAGSRICFGTFFSSPEVRLDHNVYIGAYCVIGSAQIGARTQIASSVHIVSGRHYHPRDSQGQILGSEHGAVRRIAIGSDCWIGEAAIVMADVGSGSTVGAGSVVTKDIPSKVVAVGNPARVLKPTSSGADLV